MKPLRQLSVGITIGLISAILVIGGIFLSLAETFPSLATPTQIPPTLQLNFPSITPSLVSAQSETPTSTATGTPTTVLASSSPTVCAPPPAGWIQISITDRKSTRLNSSHSQISYAVFCLKKKKKNNKNTKYKNRHNTTPI